MTAGLRKAGKKSPLYVGADHGLSAAMAGPSIQAILTFSPRPDGLRCERLEHNDAKT